MIKDEDKEFPDISGAAYLVEYLLELNISSSNGMAQIPLNFHEIEAWSRIMCVPLTPFEAKAIRSMSVAYVHQYHISNGKDGFIPFTRKPINKKEAGDKLLDALAMFHKKG